jgi:lipoprotein-anchoring transpeptidase ErfK/SrfK
MRSSRAALVLLLLGVLTVMSACGGDRPLQKQASQERATLDHLLQHAQVIGVPISLLQPVELQEQQLNNTTAPFNPFNSQPESDYYRNLAARYSSLSLQVQGLIAASTQQYHAQAQSDIQNLQASLNLRRAQGLPVQQYAQQFNQYQSMMTEARYPRDYAAISKDARSSTEALDLLQPLSSQLTTLKNTIHQMQASHLDVTAMQMTYQLDEQTLLSATTPLALQRLGTLIDAQYQQMMVNSVLALPFIARAKLSEFAQQIDLLKTYGVDASPYQKRLAVDQADANKDLSSAEYNALINRVNGDLNAMQLDLLRGEAGYLVKQFHHEVDNWSNAHLYHDSYDGQTYPLLAGYLQPGVGSDLDNALAGATSVSDYQAVVNDASNDLFDLHMAEADYNDKTPYNQEHATDRQMIEHYQLQNRMVLMVSLVEQTMRVYQNGKLIRAFHVTTGRVELPSVPGVWPVLDRESPTIFKSSEPPGSPYWYPDTPINYAILYHQGGYFVHDSWWRADYGPGTQFPHYDSGGDESFAGNGSHGCINLPEDQAAWVYNHTDWNTLIVVY